MLLYPLEKRPLFPLEPLRLSPIYHFPYLVSEDGAEQPPEEHGGEDGDAGTDEGVCGDLFQNNVCRVRVSGEEVDAGEGGG